MLQHPQTKHSLDNFVQRPSQAVLLQGQKGLGKAKLASQLAEKLLELPEGELDKYAYQLIIEPDAQSSIGIETVRSLEHFLRLRVPRSTTYNRAIVINSADRLTLEAQNALLKLLEEPPIGTVIILTTSNPRILLPTVQSRLQKLPIYRPDRDGVIAEFIARGFKEKAVQRSYLLAAGMPEVIAAILEDDNHPLIAASQLARHILGETHYQRLLRVDELAKQKELLSDICTIIQQMAVIRLQDSAGSNSLRWQRALEASYTASQQLSENAQTKLILTNLMLQL